MTFLLSSFQPRDPWKFDVSHMKGAIYVGENGEAPEMDEAIRKFQSENAGKEQVRFLLVTW